jgi:hypothetical protein
MRPGGVQVLFRLAVLAGRQLLDAPRLAFFLLWALWLPSFSSHQPLHRQPSPSTADGSDNW